MYNYYLPAGSTYLLGKLFPTKFSCFMVLNILEYIVPVMTVHLHMCSKQREPVSLLRGEAEAAESD